MEEEIIIIVTARSVEVTNGKRKFKVSSDVPIPEAQQTSLIESGIYAVTRDSRK